VEQNVAFSQQLVDISLSPATELDPSYLYGQASDVSLGAFCARPIKLAEIIWNTAAGSFDTTIDPWSLIINDSLLRKRIEGYRLLHCKLHLRIVLNGNPFLYGLAMASYTPRPSSAFMQASAADAVTCQESMKPFIFLNPTSSEAGEMVMPFFSPDNWIDLTSFNKTDMGDLRLRSINNLRHSNATSGAVQITVFGWLEDAVLAAPTQVDYDVYTIQSGDEYDSRPSAMATSIAKAAGNLARVPVIGRYARSTEIMATMFSKLAASYGFARPTIISDVCRFKHQGNGNMANTDQPDSAVKLSLDSKQELSIDPRTTGLAGEDELLVRSIVTRYAFFRTAEWLPSHEDGHVLASIRVNPLMYVANGTAGIYANKLINLPCCTVAAMFNHWKGTMVYRFQVVASSMHRGRLRIHYDPCESSSEPAYNESYTRIIDLASQRDFEFEVSWNASKGWLLTGLDWYQLPRSVTLYNGVAFNPSQHNGTLTLSIVNALTAPNPLIVQPVYINMYCKAGDDFEVAEPSQMGINSLCYVPQSGYVLQSGLEEEASVGTMQLSYSIPAVGHKVGNLDPSTHSYMGESVVSLRSVLKRYVFHSAFGVLDSPTGDYWWQEYNFPYHAGVGGETRHSGIAGVANVCNVTPLNWITPCYVGWRGGLRSKFVSRDNGNIFVRRGNLRTDITPKVVNITTSTDDTGNMSRMQRILGSGFSGCHTVSPTDGALEVEFPFYTNQRFAHARRFIDSKPDDFRIHSAAHVGAFFTTNPSHTNRGILRFVSVGEDFNVFFFLGQPLLELAANTPNPTGETYPDI